MDAPGPDTAVNHAATPGAGDEAERLAALAAYNAAGAEPGADLDNIIHLAAELLRVPIALISLVGADRQNFVARVGLEADSTSRDVSFCSHAIEGDDVFVVPDATRDARFAENPLVTGEPGIRFYAGAPLISRIGGQKLGALCIIDRIPRPGLGAREARLLSGLAALVVDRMELRRIEAERRASLARFERMTAAAPSAIVCADADGKLTHWNAAAERLFGWSAAEMLGQPIERIVPERMRAAHSTGFTRRIAAAESFAGRTVDLIALRCDGSEFPAELTLSCWREDDGRPAFGAVIHDIAGRRAAEERLQHLAHHDSLTGLANRALLAESMDKAAMRGVPMALILLDLDGFKHVNDALGHNAGDGLLCEAGARMAGRLGDRGLLVRLGGDEFAVLLTRPEAVAAPDVIARELQKSLAEKPLPIRGRVFPIRASAGTATASPGKAGSLLSNADLALYQAKAAGGGALRHFEPAMRVEYEARRTLEEEVRCAVERGEFVLLYQPQRRLADGALIGVEALLRWQHPTRGLLSPNVFLTALEVGAPAARVGDWVIDEACRQVAAWRAAGLTLRVGVNLFAEQLRRGGLDTTVEAALARHAVPAGLLELELTERIVLHKADAALQPLRRLHGRGVGIAFDDFGTGFASLSTLKRFPLTRLKIDRSFVTDLGTDPYDAAVVEAVLALGRRLELEVIAEGIETAAQETYLVAHGCEEGQGYLYGRPMPAADILCIAGTALPAPALQTEPA